MEPEQDTLRDDLEKAFEHHETEERGSAENTEEPVRPSAEEGQDEPISTEAKAEQPGKDDADADVQRLARERNQDGTFKPGEKPTKDPVAVAKEAVQRDSTPPSSAAPVGWRTQAKSEWAKIPKAAQEEILRRENETAKALSTTKNARQHFDEFNQTVAPFMPLIRAQNSTPMAAVKNLMTTAAGLTIGSPQQKAQIVAEMIGNFGIDIEMLDKVLQGQVQNGPRQQPAGTSSVEVAIQRQLGPIYDFMNSVQQSRAQREEQMRADADEAVAKFAETHDFFDDLRDDIADLMEMNANRGRNMTMDQAYKIAVSNHPEYSQITSQRRAAANAGQKNGAVARARNAASSVRGSPAVGSPTKESASRRDDIMAAWDDADSRI